VADDTIRIRGAAQHNLRNIDLDLPKNRLIVFTGVSGCMLSRFPPMPGNFYRRCPARRWIVLRDWPRL